MKARIRQMIRPAVVLVLSVAVIGSAKIVGDPAGAEWKLKDLGYRTDPFGGGWYLQSRHDITGVGKVIVTGDAGTVRIEASRGREVEIEITRVVNCTDSGEAHALAGLFTSRWERTGETLHISFECENKPMPPVAVNYRIRVPETVEVLVDIPTGIIRAYEATGDLDLRLHTGMIKLEYAHGNVRASLGTGTMDVKPPLRDSGEYTLENDNGMVNVHFMPFTRARLDVQTESGWIVDRTDLDIIEQDRHRLVAVRNGGGKRIVIRSNRGSVYIRD